MIQIVAIIADGRNTSLFGPLPASGRQLVPSGPAVVAQIPK